MPTIGQPEFKVGDRVKTNSNPPGNFKNQWGTVIAVEMTGYRVDFDFGKLRPTIMYPNEIEQFSWESYLELTE